MARIFSSLPDVCGVFNGADAAFERANQLKREGRYYQSIACYRTAVTLQPTHASAYNNLANTLKRTHASEMPCGAEPCTRRELADASIHSLHTVLRLNPKHANAYTNLASALRQKTGHLAESLHLSRVVVRLEPQHATAYENMGRALVADSAPAGAINKLGQLEAGGMLAGGQSGTDAYVVAQGFGGTSRSQWLETKHGFVRHRSSLEESARANQVTFGLQGQRASRDARRALAYSLMWLGRMDEGRAVLREGLEAGIWDVEGQYPGELTPGLPSAPYPPLTHVACVPRILEDFGMRLATEAQALLARSKLIESVDGGSDGGWDAGYWTVEKEGLHTPRDGFANVDVLAACSHAAAHGGKPSEDVRDTDVESLAKHLPTFCEVLAALKAQTNAHVELARISRLQAGVQVSIHTGLHNRRWRAHLGLQLARSYGAHMIVAGQPVTWEVGKAFIFDDSFEHEVVWDAPVPSVSLGSEEARLVLIVDFRHPNATPPGEPVCPAAPTDAKRSPLATKPACQDKGPLADCQLWAQMGECEKNPEYMHDECRRSCGKCA